MTVSIELWHLVLLAISVLGGYWALAKVAAGQTQRHLDARFAAEDKALEANHRSLGGRLDRIEAVNRADAAQWQRVERELLKLQADMPLHYVRREDYIRGQSVIEAKLDALGSKLETATLRALQTGMNHAID